MNKATGCGIAAIVVLFVFAAANQCFAGASSTSYAGDTTKVMSQQAANFESTRLGGLIKAEVAIKPRLTEDQQIIKGIFGQVHDPSRTKVGKKIDITSGTADKLRRQDITYFDFKGNYIGMQRSVYNNRTGKITIYYMDKNDRIIKTVGPFGTSSIEDDTKRRRK